jgi:glutamate N-acetyltransferase/amino-acid N-acetyltransferase
VGAEAERILPFSTGVIGEFLPVDRLKAALPQALSALNEAGWESAAKAIMTTDTRPKIASRQFMVGQQTVTVTGIKAGTGTVRLLTV